MGQRNSRPEIPAPPAPCPGANRYQSGAARTSALRDDFQRYVGSSGGGDWENGQGSGNLGRSGRSKTRGDSVVETALDIEAGRISNDGEINNQDTTSQSSNQRKREPTRISSLSSMMVSIFARSSSSSSSSSSSTAAARRPASARSTNSAQAPSSSRITARRISPFPADLPPGSCPPPRPSSASLPPGSTEPCSMMAPSVQPQRLSRPSRRRPVTPGGNAPFSSSAPPPVLPDRAPALEPPATSAPPPEMQALNTTVLSVDNLSERPPMSCSSRPESALSRQDSELSQMEWSRPPSAIGSIGSRKEWSRPTSALSVSSRPDSAINFSRDDSPSFENSTTRSCLSRPVSGVAAGRPPSGLARGEGSSSGLAPGEGSSSGLAPGEGSSSGLARGEGSSSGLARGEGSCGGWSVELLAGGHHPIQTC